MADGADRGGGVMASAGCSHNRTSAQLGSAEAVACRWSAEITRSSNAARYANTLSILTSSGVPLVEAMNIAAEVVTNQWLKRRLADATQRVSEGSSLRVALETVGYFPPMLLHMVASGESSGALDACWKKWPSISRRKSNVL